MHLPHIKTWVMRVLKQHVSHPDLKEEQFFF